MISSCNQVKPEQNLPWLPKVMPKAMHVFEDHMTCILTVDDRPT